LRKRNKQEILNLFQDAKLGIFIHWGIYAVDGIDESWAFFNKYVSYDNYVYPCPGLLCLFSNGLSC